MEILLPMLPLYSALVNPLLQGVAELKQPYVCLTERHLQALWLEQKYVRQWLTSEGEAIEVLSPGVWNTEAGPDFLKAHLRIGKQEYKGDIEIHLQDEGWHQHGHQTDERYSQVILHLSYYLPIKKKKLATTQGVVPFQAYLENILTIPAARLVKLIDLELYPYKRFAGSGQCARRLFKQLAKDRIGAFFTSAAFWRLEKKEAFLKGRLADRSLQLSGGIAMALGYKHNTEAFLDLFLFLLPYRDLPFKELLALAIGCCGFFEKEGKSKWDCSIYYQQLLVLWWGWRDRLTHQACLRLDHIRPLNHPIRRLAYLVKLMQDSKMDSLWLDMLNLWNGNAGRLSSSSACKLFFDQLIDLIPTYADDYWNKHYTFEPVPKKQMLPLIGRELKKEILINTYLPLLYAFIRETGDLAHLAPFQLFYSHLN